ncbi:MAG: SpoIIE family protein phosphatase, partial [Thermoanaerobaculia bacterium]
RERSFKGMVVRDKHALLVASRLYRVKSGSRTVVFVQPLDEEWRAALIEKNGMKSAMSISRQKTTTRVGPVVYRDDSKPSKGGVRVETPGKGYDIVPDDEDVFEKFFSRAINRKGVIWGDLTPSLTAWETGEVLEDTKLFTFFSNPWANLLDYFYNSPTYFNAVTAVILVVAGVLAVFYFLAVLLATGLIFSITRAINRIDRGTKAVERGDFTYRIDMKPRNQLGEVAHSFDKMTASVVSLLSSVGEKERLQSEIDIAASIQRNLLPKEGPSFRGVSFAAHFEPTASIGGDYYDVFNLDRSRLAVAIGDVSGHGLSTGLVMAMVKAAITTLVEEGADESALFRRLNELVFRSTEKRAFMTLGFTIFDLDRRTIRHTNAGHLYPYVLRKGEAPISIEGPSLPLGVRPDIQPNTVEIPLLEGDTLVYLSDGIVESLDAHGEPFGFDHLEKILSGMSGASPAVIQNEILASMVRHTGAAVAEDDRTLMVLRFDQLTLESVAAGDAINEPMVETRG